MKNPDTMPITQWWREKRMLLTPEIKLDVHDEELSKIIATAGRKLTLDDLIAYVEFIEETAINDAQKKQAQHTLFFLRLFKQPAPAVLMYAKETTPGVAAKPVPGCEPITVPQGEQFKKTMKNVGPKKPAKKAKPKTRRKK